MADRVRKPGPDFVVVRKPANIPETPEISGQNANDDMPTLRLSPFADVYTPIQLRELFAEMWADYAAAKAERESPRVDQAPNAPECDMGEPEL
jgi:hypothetical protein